MSIEHYANTEYFSGVKFKDFSRLIKIENPHQVNTQPVYLLFDAKNVKNYDKADKSVHQQFDSIKSENCLTFVRSKNATGVKNLCHCEVQVAGEINNKKFLAKIDYELKIAKIPHRIGLYPLKPVKGNGPTILVAALYVEDGFGKEKNKKLAKQTHHLPAMTLTKSLRQGQALTQQGFFKSHKDANVLKIIPATHVVPAIKA